MHVKYWSPGGGGRTVSSVNFVADSVESIQIIPIDEVCWHAGDANGNMTSASAEICVNSKSGFVAACRKVAKIAAKVLADHHMQPVADVTIRRHGSWPGTTHKQCPQHLTANDWGLSWQGFNQMVQVEFAALGAPQPPGYIPSGSPNGIAIHPGLVSYWQKSGGVWMVDRYALGFPTAPFHEGTRVQVFERGRLRLKVNGEIQGLLLGELTL
jgi:hypothetical protein